MVCQSIDEAKFRKQAQRNYGGTNGIPYKQILNLWLSVPFLVMFLFDKFYQSIKKPGQFARLSFYHVLMFLVTVTYPDVEQPFKGFRQVHQVGGLAVLIHDVFGEEQTAYHFHNVDKGCLVCEIERGKCLFANPLFELFRVLDAPLDKTYFSVQKSYRFINKMQIRYFFLAQTALDTI